MQACIDVDQLVSRVGVGARCDPCVDHGPDRHLTLVGEPQEQAELLARVVSRHHENGVLMAGSELFP